MSALIFAALTPEKHEFIYIDEELEKIDYDSLKPDLVAITAMSAQAGRAYYIAKRFKLRGARTVIGGIHACVRTEEVVGRCDSVIVGAGENIWPVLLEDFERGEMKEVYNAKDFPPVTGFVTPKYSACRYDRYYVFPIQATRGCPYKCDFCSIKYSSGHRYMMRPVEDVVANLREAEKYNGRGIDQKSYFFVDDNLYVNREYTKSLFQAMADAKLGIVWDGQGTVDTASDEEVVSLMAKSGCRSFSFGFESVYAESLKEANKPKCNNVENYDTVIKNLYKHGIAAGGFFIVGFDTDGPEVFQDTVEFIKRFDLFQTIASLLTPFPGTELYNRLDGEGRIFERDWTYYNSWSCVYEPKQLSVDELQAGFQWLGLQITSMEQAKRSVEVFWENAAWSNARTLNPIERLALVGIALVKLRGPHFHDYRKFLLWAARHPKAKNFRFILWAMMRNELAGKFPEHACYNPAERRAAAEAERLAAEQQTATEPLATDRLLASQASTA
ncbi:MAG: B12-binding domain-containing radical SAM protein [Coriobacteriales bacterium]|nr:B12-binding domain-containing radical SAM protein [Coriobacteriales bacterium]